MAEEKKQVKTKPAKTLNDKIDTFSSIEEVAKFYSNHRSFQPSKNTSKYGFEQFLESSYDSYSISNSFYTTGERLNAWIYAFQQEIYIKLGKTDGKTDRDDYDVAWFDKVDSSSGYVEIEIKIEKPDREDQPHAKHGLTIHIFLTTGTITCKGPMLHQFIEDLLPDIKASVAASMDNDKASVATSMDKPIHQSDPTGKMPRIPQVVTGCNDQGTDPDKLSQDILNDLRKIDLPDFLDNVQKTSENFLKVANRMESNQKEFEKKIIDKINKFTSSLEELPKHKSQVNVSPNLKEYERLEKENVSLKNQAELLHDEITVKNKKIKDLDNDVKALNFKLLEKDRLIDQLTFKLDRSSQNLRRAEEQLAQANNSHSELTECRINLSSLQTQSELLDREVKKLEDQLKEKESMIGILRKENLSLREDTSASRARAEVLLRNESSLNENINFLKELLRYNNNALNQKNTELLPHVNLETSNEEIIYVISDSMLKFIKPEGLIAENNMKITKKWSANIEEAIKVTEEINKAKCMIFHVGTNDLKHVPVDIMVQSMSKLIDLAATKSDHIIISNIIPRYDDNQLYIKLQLFNAKLSEMYLDGSEKVTISDNMNLGVRADYMSKYYDSDNIHINEEGSKILASNIKMTLHNKLNIRIPVKQRRSSSPPKKDQVPYHRGTRGGYNYRGGGGRKYRRDGNE